MNSKEQSPKSDIGDFKTLSEYNQKVIELFEKKILNQDTQKDSDTALITVSETLVDQIDEVSDRLEALTFRDQSPKPAQTKPIATKQQGSPKKKQYKQKSIVDHSHKGTPASTEKNWRKPNSTQELYKKTANYTPRDKPSTLFISLSVSEDQLRHCKRGLPVSEHWKLPENTFEKQAYLHWCQENSLAFRRHQPQIPYDAVSYVRRIKKRLVDAKRQKLERDAHRLYQEEKVSWISANPDLIVPAHWVHYNKTYWTREVDRRRVAAQKRAKKAQQKQQKLSKLNTDSSVQPTQTKRGKKASATETGSTPKRLSKTKPKSVVLSKDNEVLEKDSDQGQGPLGLTPITDLNQLPFTPWVAAEEPKPQAIPLHLPEGYQPPEPKVLPEKVQQSKSAKPRVNLIQRSYQQLTDDLCEFQVEANLLAATYPQTSALAIAEWDKLLQKLFNWVQLTSAARGNCHEQVIQLFTKIVTQTDLVNKSELYSLVNPYKLKPIPHHVLHEELDASRKKRACLLWVAESLRLKDTQTSIELYPKRVLSYDEGYYYQQVLNKEPEYLTKYFGGKQIQPHIKGLHTPLPELPPLTPQSPLSLCVAYQYHCDESLRRAADPTGDALLFDYELFFDRFYLEYWPLGIAYPDKKLEVHFTRIVPEEDPHVLVDISETSEVDLTPVETLEESQPITLPVEERERHFYKFFYNTPVFNVEGYDITDEFWAAEAEKFPEVDLQSEVESANNDQVASNQLVIRKLQVSNLADTTRSSIKIYSSFGRDITEDYWANPLTNHILVARTDPVIIHCEDPLSEEDEGFEDSVDETGAHLDKPEPAAAI